MIVRLPVQQSILLLNADFTAIEIYKETYLCYLVTELFLIKPLVRGMLIISPRVKQRRSSPYHLPTSLFKTNH